MEDQFYKENLLDHYNNPRNKRVLKNASVSGKEYNALCGDEVTVYALLDGKETVQEMAFTGDGCAISQAAASLLTEYAQGKYIHEVVQLKKDDMEIMLGISLSVVRVRCAMLPVQALLHSVQSLALNN